MYYWDGIAFARSIEFATTWRELFNQHHLLYNLIGYAEYQALGRKVRALYLLQWTNCVAGAALIWLCYRLHRRLGSSPAAAAACAALTGVAATFWKFTTDTDSYIFANLFLLGSFLVLPRAPVRGALLHLAAATMHQLSALFYPVGLVLLWRRSRERFWREALIYTAIAGGGTLVLYAAAFHLTPARPAPTFHDWLTYHADIPFSFTLSRNTGWLLLGTARLFGGGKLSRTAWVAGPIALALFVSGLFGLRKRGPGPGKFETVQPLLVWVATYLLFLFIWEPYNTFYRLFYLIPLIALGALAVCGAPARPLWMITAGLAAWNFAQFIYPATRVSNNQPLSVALEEQKHWPPGTVVIYGRYVTDLWTISYFNPQVAWIEVAPDPARVAEIAARFAPHTVYVDWTYRERAGLPAPRFTFQPQTPQNGR